MTVHTDRVAVIVSGFSKYIYILASGFNLIRLLVPSWSADLTTLIFNEFIRVEAAKEPSLLKLMHIEWKSIVKALISSVPCCDFYSLCQHSEVFRVRE